jgi:hypothetical protein
VKRKETVKALSRQLPAAFLSSLLHRPSIPRHGLDRRGKDQVEPSKEVDDSSCATRPHRGGVCARDPCHVGSVQIL